MPHSVCYSEVADRGSQRKDAGGEEDFRGEAHRN